MRVRVRIRIRVRVRVRARGFARSNAGVLVPLMSASGMRIGYS